MRDLRDKLASIFLTGLALSILLAGCSLLRPNLRASAPPPEISYNSVTSNCATPDEVHRVPPSSLNPAPYLVLYFDQCLSRERIAVIVWPGESSDINVQFAHLLGLHFEESLSYRHRVGYRHINTGPLPDDDGTSWMIVYHIIPE